MNNFPKIIIPFVGLLILLGTSMFISLMTIPVTNIVNIFTDDYMNTYMQVKTVRNILLGLNSVTLVPILTGIALNAYFDKGERLKKISFFIINMAIIVGFFSLGFLLQ